MNRKRTYFWLFLCVLIVLPIVLLELDASLSVSGQAHLMDEIIIVVLLLLAGAAFIYGWARNRAKGNEWWQDDDWSNWGGI